jgi:hypothetical protein
MQLDWVIHYAKRSHHQLGRAAVKYFGLILALAASLCFGEVRAQSPVLPGPGLPHASGGGGYVGPGDLSSGAYSWYGLRGYSAAYASGTNPAVDLVDQAGSNPVTINILSNGKLDVASISAWVSAHSVTTIRVPKLHDQSGNGRDVSNTTLANMPFLTLSSLGSLPGLTFSANDLQTASAINISQPFTVSMVDTWTGTGVGIVWFDDNLSHQVRYNNPTTLTLQNVLSATVPSSSPTSVQGLFNNTTSSITVNGTLTSGTISDATQANGHLNIGATDLIGSNPFVGSLFEIGTWASDITANNAAMTANQRAYWGF